MNILYIFAYNPSEHDPLCLCHQCVMNYKRTIYFLKGGKNIWGKNRFLYFVYKKKRVFFGIIILDAFNYVVIRLATVLRNREQIGVPNLNYLNEITKYHYRDLIWNNLKKNKKYIAYGETKKRNALKHAKGE
jgi:hypothetical protein